VIGEEDAWECRKEKKKEKKTKKENERGEEYIYKEENKRGREGTPEAGFGLIVLI